MKRAVFYMCLVVLAAADSQESEDSDSSHYGGPLLNEYYGADAQSMYYGLGLGVGILSRCEAHREKALLLVNVKHLLGVFVPECEEDGTYSPRQCHQLYCWCANAVTGHQTTPSVRQDIATLNCL